MGFGGKWGQDGEKARRVGGLYGRTEGRRIGKWRCVDEEKRRYGTYTMKDVENRIYHERF